ncbi:MAG: hypothetical protein K6G03_09810 [Lachnospiraceae bacterium]|nr:hypothetical protein [Lachnospiraceae bacterium]
MSEDNQLFRKKSLESISGPEEITDYIRVVGLNVWVVLIAVIVLLIGVVVWGYFGRLETVHNSIAIVDDQLAVCYVPADTVGEIDEDSNICIGEKEGNIISVSSEPVHAGEVYNKTQLSQLNFGEKEILYAVSADINLADGNYDAQIIVERIHPMDFVMN